jgi:hypothetical protein
MKKIYLIITITFCFSVHFCQLKAQEVDLFKTTEEEAKKKDTETTEFVTATFKATRIIHGHSVETTKKNTLDFRIHHRFGFINTGSYELFGLDNATERMSFDVGLSDRFAIGIGHSTYQKQYDGFLKYRLLRQSTGKVEMPISLTLISSMIIKTIKNTDAAKPYTANDKTSYAYQAIFARKFNEKTSIQLMPTMVHYNLVPLATDVNNMFSLGIGGRQKISKRLSITAEYYHQFNQFQDTKNSLAVGVDIETGGHVFQLHLSNSTGMTEPTFIHETTGDFFKGDIHFGFNISRSFTLKKSKGSRSVIK